MQLIGEVRLRGGILCGKWRICGDGEVRTQMLSQQMQFLNALARSLVLGAGAPQDSRCI